MSDNWLQYIPTDPEFIPTVNAAKDAVKLLESFFLSAEEIKFEFPNSINFFHPGANWTGVKCSHCGADAESWWNEVMDDADKNQFRSLMIIAPCCGAKASLNELNYVWPAGFASFVVEVMNPNHKKLSAEKLTQLSVVLNCSLREIAVHL